MGKLWTSLCTILLSWHAAQAALLHACMLQSGMHAGACTYTYVSGYPPPASPACHGGGMQQVGPPVPVSARALRAPQVRRRWSVTTYLT